MKTSVFKALSDPIRRHILLELKKGRLNAGELAEMFQISPQALSYHLRLLKEADLVMEYKVKNYIYYEWNATVFDEIYLWFKQMRGGDNEK
ncbi:MAG TPA: autorepressor SdpR family transcription factor [Bacilli bacterium]|nr:MAG: Transcriptional repressor SdpR [Tenericutes bacterium ADurb.BinA124]HNZ50639.1 autorepressor SdpR family transcription factor [Bacilli bacterium]HOH18604.1 autorepressor SdpR family transcription factor [Bacilli bacterium]HPN61531.1 autorepressor SdpR family transcription factor [Bacilli bacterium]HPX84833.1 autorepressor SdpR family transcription factor [Bacilli bacterium]